MAMPNQQLQGRTAVQPNTLSGEAEPNTLSSMRDATTGRQAGGWTTQARQRAAAGTRRAAAPRPGLPLVRLAGWVLIIIVILVILGQGR
ncbi:MAG: hypothetical protein ACHQ15_06830 [Candidatus Limnocylindrales bacterium]